MNERRRPRRPTPATPLILVVAVVTLSSASPVRPDPPPGDAESVTPASGPGPTSGTPTAPPARQESAEPAAWATEVASIEKRWANRADRAKREFGWIRGIDVETRRLLVALAASGHEERAEAQRSRELADRVARVRQEFVSDHNQYRTVLFAGTPYAMEVLYLPGPTGGPECLVLGGLRAGQEWATRSAGALRAADIRAGTLTVVPRVNGPALAKGSRSAGIDFHATRLRPAAKEPGGGASSDAQVEHGLVTLVSDADAVFVLGEENEGGSSLYYPRGLDDAGVAAVRAVARRVRPPEWEGEQGKCSGVAALRADPEARVFLDSLVELPGRRAVVEVAACRYGPESWKVEFALAALSELLTDQGVLAKPIPPHAILSAFDLIDVRTADPRIVIDMRYASADNFLGEQVYPVARCLMLCAVSNGLKRAQDYLQKRGLRLVCLDCYRPLSVQRRMWERVPNARYVADPKTGSDHNRGAAVDVTLADVSGRALEMPTAFDEFSPAAAASYKGDKVESWQQENRDLLQRAMARAGLKGIESEWWHFQLADAKDFPVLDLPLDAGCEDCRAPVAGPVE